MSNDFLKVTDEAGVRTLQLNRPERKNALTTALGWGLVKAAEAAAQDDEVRVLVVSGGEPGQAFCSGADLGGASEEAAHPRSPQNQRLDDTDWIGEFLVAFRLNCDKPVVAAINGVAVGAGVALALCADFRIAAQSAAFTNCIARALLRTVASLGPYPPSLVTGARNMGSAVGSCGEAQPRARGEVVVDDTFPDAVIARQRNCASLLSVRQTKRLVVQAP